MVRVFSITQLRDNTLPSKTPRGFTLIELLVVIAIIGILASVVMASLNSARVKARDARRISDIKQIQTALELYYLDHGQYPNIGHVIVCESNTASYAALTNALVPTYLPQIPLDPSPTGTCSSWGRRYVVASASTGYKVIAHVPENAAGQPRSLWDPRRDGGSNHSIVDGTGVWAFALYTTNMTAW